MKRQLLFGGIAVVLIVAVAFYLESRPGQYDQFAQCLDSQGATMYGSYKCGHCNEQKDMFGKSWKYVDSVECSQPNGLGQTQECADAGILAYPTWRFSDGSEELGLLSFEFLSQKTGCALPSQQ